MSFPVSSSASVTVIGSLITEVNLARFLPRITFCAPFKFFVWVPVNYLLWWELGLWLKFLFFERTLDAWMIFGGES